MIDDPNNGVFQGIDSYQRFAHSILHCGRYGLDPSAKAFLDTVAVTIKDMDVIIPTGTTYYRAQLDIVYEVVHSGRNFLETIVTPTGHPKTRMTPLPDRASSGRANPAGIPVLYMATEVETAISEIRPWVGSEVSVGTFILKRDIRAIDLSRGKSRGAGYFKSGACNGPNAATQQQIEEEVWDCIDRAFSTPITENELQSKYAPTQILAELFKSQGYEAIIYDSRFGSDTARNIALLHLNDAECISCAPYEVLKVSVCSRQKTDGWKSPPTTVTAETDS